MMSEIAWRRVAARNACVRFQMGTLKAVLGTILLAALLGGCSSLADPFMADRVTVTMETAKSKDDNAPPPPVNLDTYPETGCSFYAFALGKTTCNGYPALTAVTDGAQRREARNLLQRHIVRISDEICRVHEARIYASAASFNFGFATTASLLSGAAAVVGGETAKSALAAAAAALLGTQGHLNAEFYQNLFAHAIVQKTREIRTTKLAEITHAQSKSIDDYGADDAVRDAINYHLSCSFYEGVVALADATARRGRTKVDIDKEISDLNALKKSLSDESQKYSGKSALENAIKGQIDLIDANVRKLIILRGNLP
jgi:hypothetical protein